MQRVGRRRWLRVGVIALLLLSVIGTAAFSWPWSKPAGDTYVTKSAERGNVTSTVSTSGPISSLNTLTLSFKQNGILRQIYVKVGDRVTAGQPLAALDPADATIQLTIAKTNYDKAVAAYNLAVAGTTPADLATAKASVDSAQVALNNAQRNLEIVQESTARDLQLSQLSVESAQSSLNGVLKTLNESVIPQNEKDLAAADQTRQNAQLGLDNARKNYAATQSQITQDLKVVQLTFDNAQSSYAQAVATFNNAVATTKQDINTAALQLQTAQATLANYPTGTNAIAVENAKRVLADAQANYALVDRAQTFNVQTAYNNLVQAQQDYNDAENRVNNCNGNFSRPGCSGAPAARDAAKAKLDSAQTAYNQALITADQARLQAKSQIGNAENGVRTAQAQYDAGLLTAQQAVESARNAFASAQTKSAQSIATAQNQVDSTKASMVTAQANLDDSKAKFQSQLVSAQNSVDQAQSTYQGALKSYDQAQVRAQSNLISAQNSVDQSQQTLKTAQANYEKAKTTAQSQIASAQGQVDSARAQVNSAQAAYNKAATPPDANTINSAKASVDSAKASLDLAQGTVDDLTLKAPIAGTIATINGSVGQSTGTSASSGSGSTTSGSSGFLTMTDLNALKFTASVNEADIARIHIGQPATFSVDAFGSRQFQATIATIAPVGTTISNVVNYDVTGTVPNTNNGLLPGMTATINIVVNSAQDVIIVPALAFSTAQAQIQQGKVTAPAAPTSGTAGAGGAGAGGRAGTAGNQGGGGQGRQATPGAGFPGAQGRGGGQATPAVGVPGGGQPAIFSEIQVVPQVVLVMGADGKPQAKRVETGITDGRNTQIIAGLAEGEQVITQVVSKNQTPARSNSGGGGGGGLPGGGGGPVVAPGGR